MPPFPQAELSSLYVSNIYISVKSNICRMKGAIFLAVILIMLSSQAFGLSRNSVHAGIYGMDGDAVLGLRRMEGSSSLRDMSVRCIRLDWLSDDDVTGRLRNINMHREVDFRARYYFGGEPSDDAYVLCTLGERGRAYRRVVGVI